MKKIQQILENEYPQGELKMGGDFCFLKNEGLTVLEAPILSTKTGLEFYLADFFTGLPKFRKIKMVIGFNPQTQQYFWACNPIFSSEYRSLIEIFNSIETDGDKSQIVREIVELLQATKADIQKIRFRKHIFQIWFGETKWRKLKFGKGKRISVQTPLYS